eukprot:UN25335
MGITPTDQADGTITANTNEMYNIDSSELWTSGGGMIEVSDGTLTKQNNDGDLYCSDTRLSSTEGIPAATWNTPSTAGEYTLYIAQSDGIGGSYLRRKKYIATISEAAVGTCVGGTVDVDGASITYSTLLDTETTDEDCPSPEYSGEVTL